MVEEEVAGNTSINSKAIGVTLKVSGPGGNTGPRSASIEEAGKPVGTTTTAPVTSTTVPTGTMCTGPCKFSLPSSDALGFTTVAMNSVSVGASCPDPGSCDATSAQQIADVNITLCAGPAGSTAADSEDTHFVLKVAGGAVARRDSVTFDSSVQGSLGLYGPIGAEECIAADIYYDIPKGATWTALNYEYFQTSATAPSLYTWKN